MDFTQVSFIHGCLRSACEVGGSLDMCRFVQKVTLSISFTYKYILVENRATFSRFAQPFKIVDRTVAHDLNWICFFCLVDENLVTK